MTAAARTIRQRRTTTLPCARPAPSRRRTRSSRSRPSPACATAATMSARSARRAGTASCRACSAEILATFRARVRALIRRLFAGTEPQPPEPALWDDARRRARWVAALDADRDARLQALAPRFLRDQAITPVGEPDIAAAARTLMAPGCCLPPHAVGPRGPPGRAHRGG